jgi:hypothetical protein
MLATLKRTVLAGRKVLLRADSAERQRPWPAQLMVRRAREAVSGPDAMIISLLQLQPASRGKPCG